MGSRLRAALAAAMGLVWLGRAGIARADVEVSLDCFLEGGPVDCRTVRSAYFSSLGRVVSQAQGRPVEARLLRLRSTQLASRTRYAASLRGLTIEDDVPNALDGSAALGRVVALLQRATLPLVPLRSPLRNRNGSLTLDAGARTEQPEDAPDERAYYVRPSLGGELFEQGISVLAASASIEASASSDAARLLVTAGGTVRHLRLEVPGNQPIEGTTVGGSVDIVAARTLAGGLSAAVLTGGGRAPSNNLEAHGRAKLGLEWVRVPIRRSHESNVGLRYRIGPVAQLYVTPNVLGDDATVFIEHGLTAFTTLHTGAADLTASSWANAIVDRPSFWDVGGSLEATFPLTDALDLALSGYVRYRARAIHEPADSEQLDPIAVLANGSDFVPLAYGAELSVSFTFGNALLHAQDQRWRAI